MFDTMAASWQYHDSSTHLQALPPPLRARQVEHAVGRQLRVGPAEPRAVLAQQHGAQQRYLLHLRVCGKRRWASR